MLNWRGDRSFEINGLNFQCGDQVADLFREVPDGVNMLYKARPLLDRHVLRFQALKPKRIVELGIFKGGSTIWLHEMTKPEKLVAIDLEETPPQPLEDYINKGASNSLAAYYGTSQDDRQTLSSILEREFSWQRLDLVIDDASHFLDETRTSFNILFPRLRAGGIYVIEDWAWSHSPLMEDSRIASLFEGKSTMSLLLLQVMMALGSHQDEIAKIELYAGCAYIVRGKADLPDDFDLSKHYALHEVPDWDQALQIEKRRRYRESD